MLRCRTCHRPATDHPLPFTSTALACLLGVLDTFMEGLDDLDDSMCVASPAAAAEQARVLGPFFKAPLPNHGRHISLPLLGAASGARAATADGRPLSEAVLRPGSLTVLVASVGAGTTATIVQLAEDRVAWVVLVLCYLPPGADTASWQRRYVEEQGLPAERCRARFLVELASRGLFLLKLLELRGGKVTPAEHLRVQAREGQSYADSPEELLSRVLVAAGLTERQLQALVARVNERLVQQTGMPLVCAADDFHRLGYMRKDEFVSDRAEGAQPADLFDGRWPLKPQYSRSLATVFAAAVCGAGVSLVVAGTDPLMSQYEQLAPRAVPRELFSCVCEVPADSEPRVMLEALLDLSECSDAELDAAVCYDPYGQAGHLLELPARDLWRLLRGRNGGSKAERLKRAICAALAGYSSVISHNTSRSLVLAGEQSRRDAVDLLSRVAAAWALSTRRGHVVLEDAPFNPVAMSLGSLLCGGGTGSGTGLRFRIDEELAFDALLRFGWKEADWFGRLYAVVCGLWNAATGDKLRDRKPKANSRLLDCAVVAVLALWSQQRGLCCLADLPWVFGGDEELRGSVLAQPQMAWLRSARLPRITHLRQLDSHYPVSLASLAQQRRGDLYCCPSADASLGWFGWLDSGDGQLCCLAGVSRLYLRGGADGSPAESTRVGSMFAAEEEEHSRWLGVAGATPALRVHIELPAGSSGAARTARACCDLRGWPSSDLLVFVDRHSVSEFLSVPAEDPHVKQLLGELSAILNQLLLVL
eukprot:m51a1_g4688 hypothetical protein (761) ;mRNA; f:189169-191803